MKNIILILIIVSLTNCVAVIPGLIEIAFVATANVVQQSVRVLNRHQYEPETKAWKSMKYETMHDDTDQ